MSKDEEKKRMGTTQQTLIEITHPLFWNAYQEGRQRSLQEQYVLNDRDLVKYLRFPFRRSKRKRAKEREKDLYYSIGRLVGKMSGCVIPCQPHEDRTQDVQETFLVEVQQEYGARGLALVDTIRQLWTVQDHLAQTLDAGTFKLMLSRGVERGN
jgi:hypothetical protein